MPAKTKAPRHHGWQKEGGFITDSEKAAQYWTDNPLDNIGVVLGPSGLCSLDIDEPDKARAIFRTLGIDIDQIASSFPTITGAPGRFRIIFSVPEGMALSRHSYSENGVCIFEIRGGAVQDVLPPSIHPGTDKPYSWKTSPNGHIPLLPAQLAWLWLHWDEFKVGAERLIQPSPQRGGIITDFNAGHAVDDILREHGYKEKSGRWLAPDSSSGDPGVIILADGRVYSHHGSDPLADGHAHDAFDLFRILDYQGSQSAALAALGGVKTVAVVHNELAAEAEAEAETEVGPLLPLELVYLDDPFDDLIRSTIKSTISRSNPIQALAACMTMVSASCDIYFKTPLGGAMTGATVCIGSSSSGKSVTTRAALDLSPEMNTYNSLASYQGIEAQLEAMETPNMCVYLDEVAGFFKELVRPGSSISQAKSMIMELISSRGGNYVTRPLASKKSSTIVSPIFNLIGLSTGEAMAAAFSTDDRRTGFVQRMLWFNVDPHVKQQRGRPQQHSHDVEQIIKRLSQRDYGRDFKKRAKSVAWSDGILNQYYDIDEKIRIECDDTRSKFCELLLKVATIRAIYNDPENPVITQYLFDWAREVTEYSHAVCDWVFDQYVSAGDYHKAEKSIIAALEKYGGQLYWGRLVSRCSSFRNYSARERNEIIEGLMQSNKIFIETVAAKNGKNTKLVCLTSK